MTGLTRGLRPDTLKDVRSGTISSRFAMAPIRSLLGYIGRAFRPTAATFPCRGALRAAVRRAKRAASERWQAANEKSLPFRMKKARKLDAARKGIVRA